MGARNTPKASKFVEASPSIEPTQPVNADTEINEVVEFNGDTEPDEVIEETASEVDEVIEETVIEEVVETDEKVVEEVVEEPVLTPLFSVQTNSYNAWVTQNGANSHLANLEFNGSAYNWPAKSTEEAESILSYHIVNFKL